MGEKRRLPSTLGVTEKKEKCRKNMENVSLKLKYAKYWCADKREYLTQEQYDSGDCPHLDCPHNVDSTLERIFPYGNSGPEL